MNPGVFGINQMLFKRITGGGGGGGGLDTMEEVLHILCYLTIGHYVTPDAKNI